VDRSLRFVSWSFILQSLLLVSSEHLQGSMNKIPVLDISFVSGTRSLENSVQGFDWKTEDGIRMDFGEIDLWRGGCGVDSHGSG
jgi:hypothetical protein